MTDDRDERLARILIDLADQAQRGETVDIRREARRHPDLDDELCALWGAVMLAEAVGSHVGQLTETTPAGANHAVTLSLPYKFGDFELLEEVGRGGYGHRLPRTAGQPGPSGGGQDGAGRTISFRR